MVSGRGGKCLDSPTTRPAPEEGGAPERALRVDVGLQEAAEAQEDSVVTVSWAGPCSRSLSRPLLPKRPAGGLTEPFVGSGGGRK